MFTGKSYDEVSKAELKIESGFITSISYSILSYQETDASDNAKKPLPKKVQFHLLILEKKLQLF